VSVDEAGLWLVGSSLGDAGAVRWPCGVCGEGVGSGSVQCAV